MIKEAVVNVGWHSLEGLGNRHLLVQVAQHGLVTLRPPTNQNMSLVSTSHGKISEEETWAELTLGPLKPIPGSPTAPGAPCGPGSPCQKPEVEQWTNLVAVDSYSSWCLHCVSLPWHRVYPFLVVQIFLVAPHFLDPPGRENTYHTNARQGNEAGLFRIKINILKIWK